MASTPIEARKAEVKAAKRVNGLALGCAIVFREANFAAIVDDVEGLAAGIHGDSGAGVDIDIVESALLANYIDRLEAARAAPGPPVIARPGHFQAGRAAIENEDRAVPIDNRHSPIVLWPGTDS